MTACRLCGCPLSPDDTGPDHDTPRDCVAAMAAELVDEYDHETVAAHIGRTLQRFLVAEAIR